MEKHPMIGRVIADDYKIESFLGRGGMGSVFGGRQISLNRKVAIKLFPTYDMAEGELQRFEREIATMTNISHLNIVTIYHRGKFGDPPTLFYVMELMEGGSLRTFLTQNGKMIPSNVLRLVRPVAEALYYAHQQGCIHRDIKPDNLLFDRNYRNLKIADFGIAKLKSGVSITQSKAMVGTFVYAAPEQMHWYEKDEDEDLEVDPRADQYALGVVIYEMICGCPPYQAKNMVSLMKSLNLPPVSISERGVSISPSLEWLVSTMIAKSREERFSTDEELLAAMDSVELEVAASVSARVFVSDKTTTKSNSVKVKKRGQRELSETEKQFIQNLRTVTNSPSIETIQKYKKILVLCVCILVILSIVTIYSEYFFAETVTVEPVTEKVSVVVKVSYDVSTNDLYPLIQLIPKSENNQKPLELKTSSIDLIPGEYILLVKLDGYESVQNNKIIKIISGEKSKFVDIKLEAKSRGVNMKVLNLANQQSVNPKEIIIDNLVVGKDTLIKPGNRKLTIKFDNYSEIHEEIFISPGNDTIQLNFYLQPLKELLLTLDTVVLKADGSYYPLEVFIDGEPLNKEYYQFSFDKNRLNTNIKLQTSVKEVKLRCGYYYHKMNINDTFFLHDLSEIEVYALQKHLAQISDRDKLDKQIQYLIDNDIDKIDKLSKEDQIALYKFLVSLLEGENPKVNSPAWQLRWVLNKDEKSEAQQFIEIESLEENVTSKLGKWQSFRDQYPNGVFIRKVQKTIDYLERVVNYNDVFQRSVKDCYLSLSEKRTISNLESKIEPDDVKKIRQEMEEYVKNLNCGETLENMFKN